MYDRRFSINGTVLPAVESVRDLGVIVSHDLSPSMHVNGVVPSVRQLYIASL